MNFVFKARCSYLQNLKLSISDWQDRCKEMVSHLKSKIVLFTRGGNLYPFIMSCPCAALWCITRFSCDKRMSNTIRILRKEGNRKYEQGEIFKQARDAIAISETITHSRTDRITHSLTERGLNCQESYRIQKCFHA